MKIRLDFVTNSSSSSFICDYCGHEESGWDMSLSDAEMYRCENGHTVCESHVDGDIDWLEVVKKFILDDIAYNDRIIEHKLSSEPQQYIDENEAHKLLLTKLSDMDEDELEDIARDYDFSDNLPAACCPLCNFTSMTSEDMKRYLLEKYDLTEKDILGEIKRKFTSYKQFSSYLEEAEKESRKNNEN